MLNRRPSKDKRSLTKNPSNSSNFRPSKFGKSFSKKPGGFGRKSDSDFGARGNSERPPFRAKRDFGDRGTYAERSRFERSDRSESGGDERSSFRKPRRDFGDRDSSFAPKPRFKDFKDSEGSRSGGFHKEFPSFRKSSSDDSRSFSDKPRFPRSNFRSSEGEGRSEGRSYAPRVSRYDRDDRKPRENFRDRERAPYSPREDNRSESSEGSESNYKRAQPKKSYLDLKDRELREPNLWICGKHPVITTLTKQRRKIFQVIVTKNHEEELKELLASLQIEVPLSVVESAQIESKVGEGIAHQGYALCCSPLPVKTQQELIAEIEAAHDSSLSLPNQNLPKLLILDQLNDSHNVGAIIRSACAFGVKKIIFPSNNFPKENAAINKSSSAAIEEVDLIAASNINDLINKLKDLGYFCVALDSHVESSLADAKSNRNIALVIGSEAEGIRQLVKKNCDLVAKIDAVEFESLNASCAAAIALYEIFGKAEVR